MLIVLAASFLIMLLIGVPIAFSMLVGGSLAVLTMGTVPMSIIIQKLFYGMDSSPLLAVPLFLFAGEIMNSGGITTRLMDFASVIVGRIKGGLCHVSIVAAMIFAGVSGSAIADSAAISSITVPMMRKKGYHDDVAVSVCAAAGTIGPVIPPSIFLVLYSSITSLSIGRLFLAGAIPGLFMGISLMFVSYIYAVKRNYPKEAAVSFITIFITTRKAFFALLAPLVILLGIMSGIFSATEAGGIACLYCLIISSFYKELTYKTFKESLFKTGSSMSTVLIVLGAATIFSWLLAFAGVPELIGNMIMQFTSSANVVITLFIVLMLCLGCFIEGNALLFTLCPVFYPLIIQLGYDGIQFGIVFLLTCSIGSLTPPVGTILYTVLGVTGATLSNVGKTVWFFCLGILAVTLLVAYIPSVSLWLPNMFFD